MIAAAAVDTPLLFDLAIALPVAAVFLFFILRWIKPRDPGE